MPSSAVLVAGVKHVEQAHLSQVSRECTANLGSFWIIWGSEWKSFSTCSMRCRCLQELKSLRRSKQSIVHGGTCPASPLESKTSLDLRSPLKEVTLFQQFPESGTFYCFNLWRSTWNMLHGFHGYPRLQFICFDLNLKVFRAGSAASNICFTPPSIRHAQRRDGRLCNISSDSTDALRATVMPWHQHSMCRVMSCCEYGSSLWSSVMMCIRIGVMWASDVAKHHVRVASKSLVVVLRKEAMKGHDKQPVSSTCVRPRKKGILWNPNLQFITSVPKWIDYAMSRCPGPDVYCPESWAIANFSGAAAHCYSTPVAGIPIQAWVCFFPQNLSWVGVSSYSFHLLLSSILIGKSQM